MTNVLAKMSTQITFIMGVIIQWGITIPLLTQTNQPQNTQPADPIAALNADSSDYYKLIAVARKHFGINTPPHEPAMNVIAHYTALVVMIFVLVLYGLKIVSILNDHYANSLDGQPITLSKIRELPRQIFHSDVKAVIVMQAAMSGINIAFALIISLGLVTVASHVTDIMIAMLLVINLFGTLLLIKNVDPYTYECVKAE